MALSRFAVNSAIVATVALLALWLPGAHPVPSATAGSSATPTALSHRPIAAPAAPSRAPTSFLPPTAISASHRAPQPHAPPLSLWTNSAKCQNAWARYNQTYHDVVPPLDILHSEQSPCYIGHDEPGLNFLSNSSGSGSRVRFVVDLPVAGTYAAGAMSTFWLGMWLAGVPCSYRGQSFLEVQINPPHNSQLGITDSPNWTVQAPVWDLVPAGSCDPQCQNDTAFAYLYGRPFCENDAAVSGIGTYTSTGWGNLSSGDHLVIDLVGQVNGTQGLTVYLNDTTHPNATLKWTYGPGVTTDRRPLTPFYDRSSWTSGGWGYGLNVEATWELCPEISANGAPTSCNSYDGPFVNSLKVPTIASATFWNSSAGAYTNAFPWVATTSSAGGCNATTGSLGYVASCYDFTTYGGTGSYPYWTLHAWGGRSWWTYGGSYPNEVNNYGGPLGQFDPFGNAVTFNPTTIFNLSSSANLTALKVTAAVADPSGVKAVEVGGYWCFTGATPSVSVRSATLAVNPYDTAFEGNWSAALSLAAHRGTFQYWARAESMGGAWTQPVYGVATISAGATACTFSAPAPPGFTLANVTAVGGGYQLNWTEASAGVTSYTLWVNDTNNGTPFSLTLGPLHTASVNLCNYWLNCSNESFSLTLNATNAAGLDSGATGVVVAPPTLVPLVATIATNTSWVYWVNNANVSFVANASGGKAPYTYQFIFSDGTQSTVVSSNSSITTAHNFGAYYGTARVWDVVTDALGDQATARRVGVQVWATPLAVPQSIQAGDGYVNISWSAPVSPMAPVTSYTVYYSENPVWAWALTSAWPYNLSAPYFLSLWNTTGTHLELPVADSVTLWAQVVAWNVYGAGLLPDSSLVVTPMNATPAVLTVQSIVNGPGGPAPYNDSFSATVVGGTNDVIVNATYSLNTGVAFYPSINGSTGTSWLNGSHLFTTPGFYTVTLHAVDTFFDVAIVTVDVFIAVSTGPIVTAAVSSNPAWVDTNLTFGASGTGGSGNFTYNWTFGDGANATGSTVNHTYGHAGAYTAIVTVKDNYTNGVTVTPVAVTVLAYPTVAIQSAAGPNGSLSLQFTAVVAGGAGGGAFLWTFGDGSLLTTGVATVTHDYGSGGSYTITLVYTDLDANAAKANVTLTLGSGSGTTSTGLGSLTSSGGALLLGVGLLAVIFLIGMVYFWSRARRPPVVMAPERPALEAGPGSPPSEKS